MKIPQINLVSFDVTSATAWKEIAHSLSPRSLYRLKKEGLLTKQRIIKNSHSIDKAQGVAKTIKPTKYTAYYYPTRAQFYKELTGQGVPKDAAIYHAITMNKDELGKIILDKSLIQGVKRTKAKIRKADILYHENLEYINKIPHNNFKRKVGHNHPCVILQEFKNYNQTGGSYLRGKNNHLLKRWVNKDMIYSGISPMLSKDRLKNRDYKIAAKRIAKEFDK